MTDEAAFRNDCDVCGGKEDVRLIEERFCWGAACARLLDRGYTGRPIPWCIACRRKRGPHSFRYAKEVKS